MPARCSVPPSLARDSTVHGALEAQESVGAGHESVREAAGIKARWWQLA
jgi:hypothetical protein